MPYRLVLYSDQLHLPALPVPLRVLQLTHILRDLSQQLLSLGQQLPHRLPQRLHRRGSSLPDLLGKLCDLHGHHNQVHQLQDGHIFPGLQLFVRGKLRHWTVHRLLESGLCGLLGALQDLCKFYGHVPIVHHGHPVQQPMSEPVPREVLRAVERLQLVSRQLLFMHFIG